MRLLFATTNAGKLRELQQLVGGAVEVCSLALFPGLAAPDEDAPTFEGNARKKAVVYAEATGLPALADDSGLCVDALGGRPGVLSARYAEGDDRARWQKLLRELEGRTDRAAAFVCALGLALPGGEAVVVRGECRGEIALAPRGEGGFGYDPVFLVPSLGKTMAELTSDQKAAIGHRGRAFEKMLPHLLARSGVSARLGAK